MGSGYVLKYGANMKNGQVNCGAYTQCLDELRCSQSLARLAALSVRVGTVCSNPADGDSRGDRQNNKTFRAIFFLKDNLVSMDCTRDVSTMTESFQNLKKIKFGVIILLEKVDNDFI